MIDEELRAAAQVVDRRLVHVDAEVVVKRGEDLAELNGAFRRFAALLAYLSFDNGLMILHIGLLIACLMQSQVVTLAYCIVLWTTTMVFARLVLRRARRRSSDS